MKIALDANWLIIHEMDKPLVIIEEVLVLSDYYGIVIRRKKEGSDLSQKKKMYQ